MKYQSLRKARDIECIKMSQASKAMYKMKTKSGKKDWLEQLIVEKLLLETSKFDFAFCFIFILTSLLLQMRE